MTATWRILEGDALERLGDLPAGSVHTVVTSPPYFGLRDYGTGEWEGGDEACDHVGRMARRDGGRPATEVPRGVGGAMIASGSSMPTKTPLHFRAVCGGCGARRVDRQIGLEPSPDEFAAALVAVFREVRRVLRDDGTAWLNLGDSYADRANRRSDGESFRADRRDVVPAKRNTLGGDLGLKQKDLIGIPWMVAFALRADGWYLRSDVVWAKPNPMPESVTDRPTRSHEYVFLLSKSARYFYDADAIREADLGRDHARGVLDGQASLEPSNGVSPPHTGLRTPQGRDGLGRNKRSVWTVATQPFPGAHFATFPPKLVEPCILAGAPERSCAECGAPWRRLVERTPMVVREGPGRAGLQEAAAGGSSSRTATTGTMVEPPTSRTVGFEPSCGHDAGIAPGVVLAPFAGAGTTLMVALRHGRSAVGIELNAEYAELARRRIVDDGPLLNMAAEERAA